MLLTHLQANIFVLKVAASIAEMHDFDQSVSPAMGRIDEAVTKKQAAPEDSGAACFSFI
jgi:hypothetical protein